MKLSKTEEQLMEYLWQREQAGHADLMEDYDDPKPAATTLATLLKRMTDKGYISYKTEGKSRIYRPLVKKEDYFAKHIKGLINRFFNNSTAQFASFFTEETDLTKEELEQLRSIIDQQIDQKK